MTPAQEDDVVRMCSRKPLAAPADADRKMPSGYTAVEEYVNQLADKLVKAAARAPRRRSTATRRAPSASEKK